MSTPVSEAIEFLNIVGSKGFLNENTVIGRRNACNKFFEILGEDERTVEYVLENLETIKTRFSNLNKDVTGNTVDQYARRVGIVLKDLIAWKADRSGWERASSARQAPRSTGDGEKKPRIKMQKPAPHVEVENDQKPKRRILKLPLRPNVEAIVDLPESGFTFKDFQRIGLYLLPYVEDLESSSQYQHSIFLALGKNEAA